MPISPYKKTNLFLFFFLIIAQFDLNCMNSPWKFPPQVAQDNTLEIRTMLNDIVECLITAAKNRNHPMADELRQTTYKSIHYLIKGGYLHSWRESTPQEESLECSGYALKKILGVEHLEPSIIKYLNFSNYFEETNKPQRNDIVLYYKDQNSPVSNHTGIFIKNNHIESKCGTTPYIIEHPLFHLSSAYGKYAKFLTLKKKYAHNKAFLINVMNYDFIKNRNERYRVCTLLEIKYYEAIRNLYY